MPNSFIIYKIRKDGKYSTGSMSPCFNETGKTWTTRGAVSGHLAQFSEKEIKTKYADAQIVSFRTELYETIDVLKDVERRKENNRVKNLKQEETWAKEKLKRALIQLEKAQKTVNSIQKEITNEHN